MLEKEYEFFLGKRSELVKNHMNEFVVIRGEEILGFYSSEDEALQSMVRYDLGTFLVQQCLPANQTRQKFHSRVVFT